MSTILAIDQSPCRASYGLYRPSDFLSSTVAQQKQAVRENIADVVAKGDRLADYGPLQEVVVQIADESYLAQPAKEVVLSWIERPEFHLAETTGALVNIFI